MEHQKTIDQDSLYSKDELDLLRLLMNFLDLARKRWWLFALTMCLGIVISLVVSFVNYTPMYQCQATFTVSSKENSGFYYSANAANQMSKTFPYILGSNYFQSVLLDTMDEDHLNGTITAQTIENSNMVTIAVSSTSAEDARNILEAALQVYPEVSRFVLGNVEFQLIDEIQTPQEPFNQPNIQRVIGVGALGGLLVVSIVFLLIALLNNTLKTIEDIERFSNLDCLGVLPEVKQKARKNSRTDPLISVLDQRTPYGFRESMSSLALRIQTALHAKNGKVLMVTSSAAGEGKSTIAANLAMQLAKEDKWVVLVDLDLRNSRDAQLLDIPNGINVADVLRNPQLLEKDFVYFSKSHGIFFWGGNGREANPASLLSGAKLREILEWLKSRVDYVILDTPPCGMFQDAAVLADCADASLLVVRHDAITESNMRETLSLLNSTTISVLGYVLNGYPQTTSHYGYGRYGYGKYGYGKYGYGESQKQMPKEHSPEHRGIPL